MCQASNAEARTKTHSRWANHTDGGCRGRGSRGVLGAACWCSGLRSSPEGRWHSCCVTIGRNEGQSVYVACPRLHRTLQSWITSHGCSVSILCSFYCGLAQKHKGNNPKLPWQPEGGKGQDRLFGKSVHLSRAPWRGENLPRGRGQGAPWAVNIPLHTELLVGRCVVGERWGWGV